MQLRWRGGEQLGELTPEHVNELIPTNIQFGRFESVTTAGPTAGGEAAATVPVPLPYLGLLPVGLSFGYQQSAGGGSEAGHSTTVAPVLPMRKTLFTEAWKDTRLETGSWRGGLMFFQPPKSAENACSVLLTTPEKTPIATVDFEGILSAGDTIRRGTETYRYDTE